MTEAMLAEATCSLWLPARLICPGCARGFRSRMADQALSEHMQTCSDWAKAKQYTLDLVLGRRWW